jgi:amino acid transporter
VFGWCVQTQAQLKSQAPLIDSYDKFGEFEFWCSTFKIVTLTGLILMGIVLDLGGGPSGDRMGFRTWRDVPFSTYLYPGSKGKMFGFLYALTSALYSYTGTEMVGIAIGEMKNPRRNGGSCSDLKLPL